MTYAPLPTFKQLFFAFFNQPKPAALAYPLQRETEPYFWLARSQHSLSLLAQLRLRFSPKKNITIWIPDYFCNSVLDPLRTFGAQLVFYPVTESLSPDITWCSQHAANNPPDLLIVVHYFGQPTPIQEAVIFCKMHQAWLIEDAAHVLKPISGVGEVGDFILYSPHKHLAIPDGALLLARNPSVVPLLEKLYAEISYQPPVFKSMRWLVKRLLQKTQLIPIRPMSVDSPHSIPSQLLYKISSFSQKLLSVQLNALDQFAMLRQKNKQILHAQMISQSEIMPWEMSDTPYLAGFICETAEVAKQHYACFQKQGYPVQTWPDLAPEVLSAPDVYPVANRFYRTRLFVGVHQTLKIPPNPPFKRG